MTIIVSPSAAGAGRIGYKNLYNNSGVTVTASTEAAGFEKENIYDNLGYDWWKPTATGDSWVRASFASAQTANYMAVWGHNLSDHGASVKPQYSTDGGSVWNDAASAIMPSDNNTLFFSWADIPAADWRILLNAPTTIPSIAAVQIGEVLVLEHSMEVGFAPPSMTPIKRLKTALSEDGSFIGGSNISEGIRGSFSLTNITPAWIRSDWEPFIAHAQTPKPFVFSWDVANHSSEIVLAWVTQQIPAPNYNSPLYMDLSLNFEGTL